MEDINLDEISRNVQQGATSLGRWAKFKAAFKAKYGQLGTGYKVLAAVAITAGVIAVLAAIAFYPVVGGDALLYALGSGALTDTLLGSILLIGGSVLAGVTILGHLLHIYSKSLPVDGVAAYQQLTGSATASASSATHDRSVEAAQERIAAREAKKKEKTIENDETSSSTQSDISAQSSAAIVSSLTPSAFSKEKDKKQDAEKSDVKKSTKKKEKTKDGTGSTVEKEQRKLKKLEKQKKKEEEARVKAEEKAKQREEGERRMTVFDGTSNSETSTFSFAALTTKFGFGNQSGKQKKETLLGSGSGKENQEKDGRRLSNSSNSSE